MQLFIRIIIISILGLSVLSTWLYRHFLQKKLAKEKWLAIVDQAGTVYGKIPESLSLSGQKYLHPTIRIALIYKGMVFLKETSSLHQQWDYPFEHDLRYRETLEEGIKAAFKAGEESADLPAHFIFRYLHEKNNRLIYLYCYPITNENQLNQLSLKTGKWWTSKQIEENVGSDLFSSYFKREFELLSSTVLPAMLRMQPSVTLIDDVRNTNPASVWQP
jgi:hypothetical protein